MGDRYLTDLAAVLRATGPVVEYQGWKTRSRSSGGYSSGDPCCIMHHHTASSSSASAQADCDYMCLYSDAKPTANLYLARDATWWVMAAGATNTNGKGRSRTFSRHTVPADSMNTHAIGIEVGNNGVGEPYPQAVIDRLLAGTIALADAYGLAVTDVDTHQDYAPDRKVDPATCAAVQGPWRPASVTGSGSWSVADIRAELTRRAATGGGTDTIPPPSALPLGAVHDEGDPMFITSKDGKYWIGNGLGRRQLADNDEVDFLIDKFGRAKTPLINLQGGQQVTSRGQINTTQKLTQLGVVVG